LVRVVLGPILDFEVPEERPEVIHGLLEGDGRTPNVLDDPLFVVAVIVTGLGGLREGQAGYGPGLRWGITARGPTTVHSVVITIVRVAIEAAVGRRAGGSTSEGR
jgi:hypothetical protein